MTRERFYAERDRRTVEYGLADPFEEPVAIVVAPSVAESDAGQVAVLGLANMAARIHRRLRLVVPDAALLVPSMVGATSLVEEVTTLVHEIDPYNELHASDSLTGFDLPEIALGVGPVDGVRLCVSADRYAVSIDRDVAPMGQDPSTIIGAAGAACVGAAALTRMSIGRTVNPRRVSFWAMTEGQVEPGPGERVSALDLGDVAVIGAGAVASGLAYWTRYVGIVGDWVFVDGDVVKLHNTNRGLGLLAADAGWAGGEPGGDIAMKAVVTADLLRVRNYPGWYDDWLVEERGHPDLLLPLANGPGLRSATGQRGEPLLLHATTSRMWTGELHRHLAEDDGCISCRFPDAPMPNFECSTSPLPDTAGPSDAALPFLSGSGGLLLLVGLIHLANGRLPDFDRNQWQMHLDLGDRRTLSSRRWSCSETCGVRRNLPRELRRRLPRGTRWAHLD